MKKRAQHMGAFFAPIMALVAMACTCGTCGTCGPLSTVRNIQATAQGAVATGQGVMTQVGEIAPTAQAAMTQAADLAPTAQAAMTQAAVNLPTVEAQMTEMMVTVNAAMTESAGEAVAQVGTVTGQVCYPSEGIPPMTIYAQDRVTGIVLDLDHSDGSPQYAFGYLPPGQYVFFAYTNWDGADELSGGYTEFVNNPEGSHNLIPVTVAVGETITGVDICDWYAAPGETDIPARP